MMPPPLSVLIWLLALICFGYAAALRKEPRAVRLIALGLFLLTFWVVVR